MSETSKCRCTDYGLLLWLLLFMTCSNCTTVGTTRSAVTRIEKAVAAQATNGANR
jgi:hypothetical protein